MEYLPETQIAQFSPASNSALAQYIATQRGHAELFPWVVGLLIFANLALAGGAWPALVLAVPLSVYGAWYIYGWDRQRTHVSLTYEMDVNETQRYQQVCADIGLLATTARLQRVEARQVHGDWKHQAGTRTSLQLAPVSVLPPGKTRWLETNVPAWGIHWRQGKVALTFLPDRVILEQGKQVAAVLYPELQITITRGRFVERGSVPSDAQVVGHNWQYPNKDGRPDRRFKNNRQWPVIEVAYIGLQSQSGLTLALQASNRQHAEQFVQGLRAYKPLVCADPVVA